MATKVVGAASWFGFAAVTLFAVLGIIDLSSPEHVFGTAVFLLSGMFAYIITRPKAGSNGR